MNVRIKKNTYNVIRGEKFSIRFDFEIVFISFDFVVVVVKSNRMYNGIFQRTNFVCFLLFFFGRLSYRLSLFLFLLFIFFSLQYFNLTLIHLLG